MWTRRALRPPRRRPPIARARPGPARTTGSHTVIGLLASYPSLTLGLLVPAALAIVAFWST